MNEQDVQRLIDTANLLYGAQSQLTPDIQGAYEAERALYTPVTTPEEYFKVINEGGVPQVVGLEAFLQDIPEQKFTPTQIPTGLEGAITGLADAQKQAAAAGVEGAQRNAQLGLLALLNSVGQNISQAFAPTPNSLATQNYQTAQQQVGQAAQDYISAQTTANQTNATATAQQNLLLQQLKFDVAQKNAEKLDAVNAVNAKRKLDIRLASIDSMQKFANFLGAATGKRIDRDYAQSQAAQDFVNDAVLKKMELDSQERRARIMAAAQSQSRLAPGYAIDLYKQSIGQSIGNAFTELHNLSQSFPEFQGSGWFGLPVGRDKEAKEKFIQNIGTFDQIIAGVEEIKDNYRSEADGAIQKLLARGLNDEAARIQADYLKFDAIMSRFPRPQNKDESPEDYAEYLIKWQESDEAQNIQGVMDALMSGNIDQAVSRIGGLDVNNAPVVSYGNAVASIFRLTGGLGNQSMNDFIRKHRSTIEGEFRKNGIEPVSGMRKLIEDVNAQLEAASQGENLGERGSGLSYKSGSRRVPGSSGQPDTLREATGEDKIGSFLENRQQ